MGSIFACKKLYIPFNSVESDHRYNLLQCVLACALLQYSNRMHAECGKNPHMSWRRRCLGIRLSHCHHQPAIPGSNSPSTKQHQIPAPIHREFFDRDVDAIYEILGLHATTAAPSKGIKGVESRLHNKDVKWSSSDWCFPIVDGSGVAS